MTKKAKKQEACPIGRAMDGDTKKCTKLDIGLILCILAGLLVIIGALTPWFYISIDGNADGVSEATASMGINGITYQDQTFVLPDGGQTLISFFGIVFILTALVVIVASLSKGRKGIIGAFIPLFIEVLIFSYLFLSIFPQAVSDSGLSLIMAPAIGFFLIWGGAIILIPAIFLKK